MGITEKENVNYYGRMRYIYILLKVLEKNYSGNFFRTLKYGRVKIEAPWFWRSRPGPKLSSV